MEENYGYIPESKPIEKENKKMEEKYYYVSLEQISENVDLSEEVIGEYEIIGHYPHKAVINNIVKDETGYNINLVVTYDSQKGIATEALTGIEIPVYNMYEDEKLNKITTAHTYIKNAFDEKNISTVFTDRTCIDTMPKTEVKSKLEMYFHKYNNTQKLSQLLSYVFSNGERKYAKALVNYHNKIKEEQELNEEVSELIRKLKNHS